MESFVTEFHGPDGDRGIDRNHLHPAHANPAQQFARPTV